MSPNRGAFRRRDGRNPAVIGGVWIEDDGLSGNKNAKARVRVGSNYIFGNLRARQGIAESVL